MAIWIKLDWRFSGRCQRNFPCVIRNDERGGLIWCHCCCLHKTNFSVVCDVSCLCKLEQILFLKNYFVTCFSAAVIDLTSLLCLWFSVQVVCNSPICQTQKRGIVRTDNRMKEKVRNENVLIHVLVLPRSSLSFCITCNKQKKKIEISSLNRNFTLK